MRIVLLFLFMKVLQYITLLSVEIGYKIGHGPEMNYLGTKLSQNYVFDTRQSSPAKYNPGAFCWTLTRLQLVDHGQQIVKQQLNCSTASKLEFIQNMKLKMGSEQYGGASNKNTCFRCDYFVKIQKLNTDRNKLSEKIRWWQLSCFIFIYLSFKLLIIFSCTVNPQPPRLRYCDTKTHKQ